jgi:hypothetical protein
MIVILINIIIIIIIIVISPPSASSASSSYHHHHHHHLTSVADGHPLAVEPLAVQVLREGLLHRLPPRQRVRPLQDRV